MTAAFFVTLREGLEAALIIGIIVAYLVKTGHRDAVRLVGLGVAAALGLALVIGVIVAFTVGRMPLAVQETFEGIAAILAVVVLTWMLFWMRKQGRAIKGELEASIDDALSRGSTYALVILAFGVVLREGLETVLFLLAVLGASGDTLVALTGAVLGLVVATVIGWAIFAMGRRINLGRFFNITGFVLIFVAAGLCAYAVHELTGAGWLPLTPVAFDLSGVLSERGPIGSVLSGLLGYRAAPTWSELIAYLGYLIPVLLIFLAPTIGFSRSRSASQAAHD